MIRVLPILLTAAVLFFGVAAPLQAQSPGAAQANSAAYDIYSTGDYKAASAAYEKLIKDYPTDLVIPTAQIQLAFTYYFLARFDDALAILDKAVKGPPLPAELKQVVDSFIPQILSAKAAAMPMNDPKRVTTFNDAIKKFTDFINAYPQAPDLESAIYGRAIAEYQIQKYDDVVKDLELNIQKFPNSSTIPTSKNLLAIAYATQGSIELNNPSGDRAKAFGLYQKAITLLRSIIDNKKDVALINEANFQLGEILFNQAAFSPEADRAALYQQALDAYRAVAPKDAIVALQQAKIKDFPSRRLEAIKARDQAKLKLLEKENERELKKLAELQGKPDQVASALAKMGEIFFGQQQLNAARVVFQHVDPFLTTDDDKMRALYFTTMTYALQGVTDKAVAGYNEFQSKYKADPVADNLPVTIGNMYLAQNNLPEAIKYFNESLTLYPKGRFVGISVVSKAAAEARTGKYAEAEATFKDYLSKNPPPEVGVIALSGLAGVYKDTQKWDDAIKSYQEVRSKYPNTPQADEASYWIAIGTQQKGDNAGAIPLLDEYVKAHPKTVFAPLALYTKAAAQLAVGQKEEGIATMAQVAADYPDSQPAPFSYFIRAQLRAQEAKNDEVVALMKAFIEKYPKDDKVYNAYETIAQIQTNAGQTDDALATYREYVAKYPDNPQAALALVKVATMQRMKAEGLGRYGALNEQERALWKIYIDGSIAASEELIKKYPDSPAVPETLQNLLRIQRTMLTAELKKAPEVEQYFEALAENAPNANAKSKIQFALANYVSESDKAKALEIMNAAYNPDVVYAPQDLDVYGLALIDAKKLDQATAVFQKIAKDYPTPAGTQPQAALPQIQEAQAISLFGLGRVAQAGGDAAKAGQFFEQLKLLYGWSPKVLEANYGIAVAFKDQGKLDEAQNLLRGVIAGQQATAELRANATLLTGYILVERAKAETDPKKKSDLLGSAIDTFSKIGDYFEGVPVAAAEGLWMAGQLLEQQAAGITDPKQKSLQNQQFNRARSTYEQLVKDYPNSQYAPKAQERLTALGPKQ
ncbi:hypothetical protein DB345_18010 [Spartobacteria bacterium LR76]|nr:hypothetical protein DB345_18010 [Spartobacteria bacterium LR76]